MAVERDFLGLEFVHFSALEEVKGLVLLAWTVYCCLFYAVHGE